MKFTKHDSVKSRLDLLPPLALEIVGYVLRHGALKYDEENWRLCKKSKKYVRPILTHAFKHLQGQFTDPESGLPHLAHAVCNALFALDLAIKLGYGDRMAHSYNYFAVVHRTRPKAKRGKVKKRAKTYETLWTWLTAQGLDPKLYVIKTVRPADKVGTIVTI